MRALVAVGMLGLAGCSSEAANLERQYEIVAKGRDNQATCEAARKVADAHLRANDAPQYETWKLRADIKCSTASYEPYDTQGIEPDNMEAMPDNTGL